MADNVVANAGSGGAIFATDDDGTAHHPYVKLEFGADNTQTKVSTTNPLPVMGTGTAGTANANVLTVQGIASMTALQIADNSGSLTVDAPVGTPVFVRLSDGSAAITTLPVSVATIPSHEVTNAGTFAVQATIASGATAIAKAEDAASANADVGVPAMAVQKATPANTAGTDGDYEFLQMSAGRLWCSTTIDAALPAGTNAIGKLAANSGVDIGDVDVTSVTPGTTASALGKAEDAGHSSGDVGVMALSVRQDTAAALGGTDADYQPLITDGSGRLHVNVGNTVTVASHAVTNAGTFAVQESGTHVLVDDAAFTPGTTKVLMAGFEADEASTDSVDEGDGGAARMTLDRKVITTPQPHTAGGLSIFRTLDLDETEEDVKTAAGQVYGWYFFNASTSIRYLKFYNATAASVTVGTTTPVLTFPLPAASSGGVGGNILGAMGIAFDTAICVAATTGLADNDTGAPSANDVILNVFYK